MKNFLVAGASTGIGRSLVQMLLDKQHQVYVITRTPAAFDPHPQLHVLEGNIMESSWKAEGFPTVLHGVVYAPGTINLKPFRGLKADDFRNDFEVNVIGAIKVIQAALPMLKAAGSAAVVLFSTVAVAQGMPFHSSIAASKGAVEGLARSLAAELAPGIRVNVVAPSLTDTPLAARLLSTPEKVEASAKRHPLQRVGHAGDIASMAAFLLSDEASWISGQVIGVDGGLSRLRI